MDSAILQKHLRDNAEDIQNYASSLKDWEDEMKKKEEELLTLNSQKDISSLNENILKHEEADSHKKKGNDFVKASKWKEAIEEYSLSISLYPNDAIYYGNRSFCYMQLEDWDAAENDCDQALELKPDYVKVALRRANIRRKKGNLIGAANDYDLILVLEPKNNTALKEYESIFPELRKSFADLNVILPDFVEMHPSLKSVQEDESKLSDSNMVMKKGKIQPSNIVSEKHKEDIASKIEKPNNKMLNYLELKLEKPKPPHLRSKLPLRRIKIEDVYLNLDDDIASLLF